MKNTLDVGFPKFKQKDCKNGNREQKKSRPKIENGDILFCNQTEGVLSEAINKVTQTARTTQYTHMGIAEITDKQVFVLHASPQKGVCKEHLSNFLQNGNQSSNASVYRLKPGYQATVPNALKRANVLLGQPYDDTFILENDGFYCSNYIQQVFDMPSIFKLEPMTFKDPHTGEYLEQWEKHYNKLGIEIPEGKLGCNPNGMATSEAIIYIGKL